VTISILNQFNSKDIKGDLFGGLTAAVIALPLALAFGVSSGAGAIAGVYGAIFTGFFAALFGGTASQISGPTGPMTVVVALMLTKMIAAHPDGGLVLAFSAVVLAGLLQILFGLVHLGKYFVMVPYAVISGFMTGIGIIIITLQIAPIMGVDSYSSVLISIQKIPHSIEHLNLWAFLTGGLTLLIMMFWPKVFAKLIPAPLFALVSMTLLVLLIPTSANIPIIGTIPTGFPEIVVPQLSLDVLKEISYFAFLLAVLGSIDSLLTSMVADVMTETHHHSDKELIGQGIGNAIAGLFGALPGAGATMRTAININAGGHSALSGIIHSLVLLIIVLGAGKYAQFIPHAVLAGMLLKVGIDIIDWRFISRMHKLPLFSSCLMLLVFTLTVFVDLITAVAVGMFIANIVTLDRLTHLQLDSISINMGSKLYPNAHADLSKTLVLEISGPVSFAVSRELSRRLSDATYFEVLLIDLSKAHLIGTTTSIMIIDLIERTHHKHKQVRLVMGSKKINSGIKKLPIESLIKKQFQYESLKHALECIQSKV